MGVGKVRLAEPGRLWANWSTQLTNCGFSEEKLPEKIKLEREDTQWREKDTQSHLRPSNTLCKHEYIHIYIQMKSKQKANPFKIKPKIP